GWNDPAEISRDVGNGRQREMVQVHRDSPTGSPQVVRYTVAKLERGLLLRNLGICVEIDHLATGIDRAADRKAPLVATRRRRLAPAMEIRERHTPRNPDAIQRAGEM